MGWRAVRLALERDGLLKVQARALLEAAAGRTLHVMFPMISEPWELLEAKAVFQKQYDWLAKKDRKLPKTIHYGAMLEVPALAETLDFVLPELDFLSIGTNDLTQFLFAADRANPKLAERYDWLSVAILRFLARVVRTCGEYKVPVSVCGEMGGRTLEAMALLGLGIRRLSITPASIGPVKAMVRSLDLAALSVHCEELLKAHVPNLREPLVQWASDNGVELN
jgi:phosphotransferase system enzyme I (PtsP)